SYNIAKEMGGDQTITMEALTNDATANTKLLLAAGIIMIITLWTSKRALSVSKTELSLSSQDEGGGEQYGSTSASRGLVRMAMAINTSYERIMPQRIQQAIAKRFEPLSQEEREGGSYDLIRATVNLTTAAILISIATSLKLPLSTTYVCFMVSMGSSLADRAWGRESAVYRISGVLTVVSGWFITGFGAMLIAFVVALVLAYGGNVAIVLVSLMCGYMLLRSNLKKNKQAAQAEEAKPEVISAEDAINRGITDVIDTMRSITKIYDRTLIATFKENRKALKEVVQQSNEIYERSKERKYEIMPTIARMTEHEINAAQYYVQVVDYLNEISKSLIHITRPCFDHIDNNHEGMSKEQIDDLMKINDDVEQIFSHVNIMLQRNDFGDLDLIMEMRDQLFESISEATANQLLRIKHKETST
ncbi:MAG: inorganic phosphate transporter, partial [Alistipes sp.]|nr:inorganic phosphate transporter [Alistipes sp.]